jgi:hypothetical protein
VSATVATLPRRWLTNSGLLVAALALGLGLALAFHAVVDDATGTNQPSRSNVRGSLSHALASNPSTSDPEIAAGATASIEPPSVAPSTPDRAVDTFLALEVAQDYDGSYGVLSEPDRANATSRAAWAVEHAELPAITGYEITAVQQLEARAEVLREVKLYGELHRFIPVLAAARGFRVGEIEITHRRRKFGYSKYGVRRFVKGFLDLLTVYFLTGFEQRPQHLLGTCGIAAFALGLVGLTYLSIGWLLVNAVGWNELFPSWKFQPLHERPALLYSVAMLLLGAQFISMGFLAELFTAYYGRANVPYSIKARAGQWPGGGKP